MSDLLDLEALVTHGREPVDDVSGIDGRAVAHGKQPVVRPPEQRDAVLIRFSGRLHDREKRMGDTNIYALVIPVQRRSRQVVHAREVRPAVPLDRQLRQLVQGPPVLLVRLPELLDVEPGLYGRREHIERLREEVLPLLRVVLSLQGIVQDLGRTDGHAVVRVRHFVDDRVRIVDVPVLVRVRAAHEYKVLFVLDRPVEDLPAVFDPLAEEALRVVSRRRDTDQQLVRVCLLAFLEQVVLLRLLEGVDLVTDTEVRVQGVLRVRVGRQCAYEKRAVREGRLHGVLVIVVDDLDQAAFLPADLALTQTVNIIIEEVERLKRLHQSR